MIATLRLILDQVRVQGVEVQNIHFRLLAESRAEPQHYGSLRSPSCCGSAKSVNHVVSTSVSDVVRTFTAPPYPLHRLSLGIGIRASSRRLLQSHSYRVPVFNSAWPATASATCGMSVILSTFR